MLFRSKCAIGAALTTGLLTLFVLLIPRPVRALVSYDYVVNNLPNAVSTIVNAETDNYWRMHNCLGTQKDRACVNLAAYNYWFSIMPRGNAATQIEVDSGTKEVPLRLKALLFYAAPMVQPSSNPYYGSDWQTIVTAGNFPNDRHLNTYCGNWGASGTMCPAMTMLRWKITRIWTDSPGVYAEGGTGYTQMASSDGSTRYWFSDDMNFTVKSSSAEGLRGDQDIVVHARYRLAAQFYNDFREVASANNACWTGGGSIGFSQIDRCGEAEMAFTIKVKVRAPNVEGTTTVDNPSNKSTAQTKKDSKGNGSGSVSMDGQTTQVGNGATATSTKNRPGQRLSWWFSAYNKGPGPTLSSFDLANYRSGWADNSWNVSGVSDTNKINWIQPKISQGATYKYGCYDWGGTCKFNGSTLNQSQAEGKHFTYLIKQDDVGRTLCQRLRWSWNESGWKEVITPNACAYIPYHYPSCDPSKSDCNKNPPKDCYWYGNCPGQTVPKYGVVPTTSYVGGGTAMMGDTVKFKYTISNSSSFTKTKNMNYRAHIFILRGGEIIANASGAHSYSGNVAICGSSSARGINGSQVRSGAPCTTPLSGSTVIQAGGSWGPQERSITLNDSYNSVQPGDQVCSYLTVDKWSVIDDAEAPSTVASNVACVRIGKHPQIQINGSDSYAKNGFTGTAFPSGSALTGSTNRGSYSQYGLLTNNGAASNFGSAGYTVVTSGNKSKACKLTWSNAQGASESCDSGSVYRPAKLTHSLSAPSMAGSAKKLNSNSVNLSTLQSGEYRYDGTELKIYGTPQSGRKIAIYASGNVRLTNDGTGRVGVSESSTYSNLAQIPQLTVVANGNVSVDSNVTTITGNFIAKTGRFVSCVDSSSSDLGITGACKNKLKINGSVVSSGNPQLRRTFGAGNSSGTNQSDNNRINTTSEWFNYTPNSYLSPSSSIGSVLPIGFKTRMQTSLPVRY